MNDKFAGERVLVMGLGSFGGGVGAARFLVSQGAKVTVTDLRTEEQLAQSLAQLARLPISYHLGGHREEDFTPAHADLIVANPAVPYDSPYLAVAGAEGVEVTAEICIFFPLCRAPIVGVTGSNGKSTTCAMIGAVLESTVKSQGQQVWLGGNIGGVNLLERIDEIKPRDTVVLELSSFQLYYLGQTGRSPHIAVVTNITANHLDWHGDMDAYVRAKQNILRGQSAGDHAVLNRLDRALGDWADLTAGQVIWYPNKGWEVIDLQVPGRHNQLNAAAALAVADVLGVEEGAARDALQQFAGLAHRLELVAEIAGVRYYNDSIATTPDSVIAAVSAFAEKKVLILGGYDKKIPLKGLAENLVHDGRVEAAIVMGQVRDELIEQIENAKVEAGTELPRCLRAGDLSQAVTLAKDAAGAGMIVLLSPGCASYDMFRNFQDRGEQFRSIVAKLI